MKALKWILAGVLAAGGATMAQSTLPSGHPDLPMPPGHAAPTMPGVAGPANPAAPDPLKGKVASHGTLFIKVVQGTPGGPAVGADPVVIEYFDGHGHSMGKTETKLNAQGELKLDRIPLQMMLVPVVTVTHGQMNYPARGRPMHGKDAEQQVQVTVFETAEESAWQMGMRHIMIEPSASGLAITDMISVTNTGDRTWVGKAPQAGQPPVTLALAYPAGATSVTAIDGSVADGQVKWATPIMPGPSGATQFQAKYTIPANGDSAQVTLVAPVATGKVMIFLPEDGTTLTSEQFQQLQPRPGAQLKENSRFFASSPLQKGDRLTFTVGNLKGVRAPIDATPKAAKKSGMPTAVKVLGIVGVLAILAGGLVWMAVKAAKGSREI